MCVPVSLAFALQRADTVALRRPPGSYTAVRGVCDIQELYERSKQLGFVPFQQTLMKCSLAYHPTECLEYTGNRCSPVNITTHIDPKYIDLSIQPSQGCSQSALQSFGSHHSVSASASAIERRAAVVVSQPTLPYASHIVCFC